MKTTDPTIPAPDDFTDEQLVEAVAKRFPDPWTLVHAVNEARVRLGLVPEPSPKLIERIRGWSR